MSDEQRYFLIFPKSKSEKGDNPVGLEKFGKLTVPDSKLVLQISECRFPWSDFSETEGSGSKVGYIFFALFMDVGLVSEAKRPLMGEEFKRLMVDRLKIWNSRMPEDDSDALLERVNAENERLFSALITK